MLLGLVGWKDGVCAVAGELPPPPGVNYPTRLGTSRLGEALFFLFLPPA